MYLVAVYTYLAAFRTPKSRILKEQTHVRACAYAAMTRSCEETSSDCSCVRWFEANEKRASRRDWNVDFKVDIRVHSNFLTYVSREIYLFLNWTRFYGCILWKIFDIYLNLTRLKKKKNWLKDYIFCEDIYDCIILNS